MAQLLAPGEPNSPERLALIEQFEKKIAGLDKSFERRTHREVDSWRMPYALFSPSGAGKHPLIVYLHGSGGLGSDNQKQFTGANRFGLLLWALPETQRMQPSFVVAPQTDRGWVGNGAVAVADLVTTLRRELAIDERRVYVLGNSMGGGGTWHLLAHRGELFAAAAPICGSKTGETGGENPRIPVWNFHGDADDTVNVQISRDRIAARRKAGGSPRYTEYRGVGHNVSRWACTEPALPEWLFAQRR